MKAMAVSGYGPLERLHEVEGPEGAPGTSEVLVHVVASALNPADYKVIGGTMTLLHGRTSPLIMGYDFSGTVKGVGPGVRQLAIGDDVFLHPGIGHEIPAEVEREIRAFFAAH